MQPRCLSFRREDAAGSPQAGAQSSQCISLFNTCFRVFEFRKIWVQVTCQEQKPLVWRTLNCTYVRIICSKPFVSLKDESLQHQTLTQIIGRDPRGREWLQLAAQTGPALLKKAGTLRNRSRKKKKVILGCCVETSSFVNSCVIFISLT